MITLFALPKAFEGHIGVIQRNAIESWTRLSPSPQIVLFGDEGGTAEIAREMGLRHVPQIARNEYGTPLVSEIFLGAQREAAEGALCYVNCDIMLMSDFARAVEGMLARRKRFLMAGRRWSVDLPFAWDFEGDWEARLRERVRQQAVLDPPHSIDYFLFPANFWQGIPPFAIGRFFWDNWLLYQAQHQGAAVVDASEAVMAVHQNHGYAHQGVVNNDIHHGPEAQQNLALAGGVHHLYSLSLATHRLTAQGLRRRPPGRWQIERWQHRWNHHSRAGLEALERFAGRGAAGRLLGSPLLWAARRSTPLRQHVGRALVAWRERKTG